ncbi:hypothetical protein GCM10023168_35640 [Fodinibacter luteus]|uniref:OsmC-like protein n=1 Tax=Fodinibacter luteus TaxID=552064 RepID=A0ABP8KRP8_9MICO
MTQNPRPVQAPLEYRVSAATMGNGGAQVTAAGAAIPVDVTWGGAPDGPGPAELLAAALAARLLRNLSRCGELIDFRYDGAEVDVVARRQDSPPRFVEFTYALRVSTDEPEHRVNLAHTNLRKFGTVFNTLAAVCEVHGTLEAFPRMEHD